MLGDSLAPQFGRAGAPGCAGPTSLSWGRVFLLWLLDLPTHTGHCQAGTEASTRLRGNKSHASLRPELQDCTLSQRCAVGKKKIFGIQMYESLILF